MNGAMGKSEFELTDANLHRRRLVFSGRVQGVGFRYTSRQAATRFAVTGWVRNLIDGRVELVAEGTDDQLDLMVGEIRQSTSGNVTEITVDRQAATGEFPDFSIRY